MNSYAHRDAVANRKVGTVPANFKWYGFECVGPDIMFTGSVVTGVVTKGPRKGRDRWSRDPQDIRKVVVTDAECDAEYVRFEAETGKCGHCKGDGRIVKGWHHITGTSYRECPTCRGTLLASTGTVTASPAAAQE